MEFQCPNCEAELEVADAEFAEDLTRKVDCPSCDESLIVEKDGTVSLDEDADDDDDNYYDDEDDE